MDRIEIVKSDITQLSVDAVVNAANSGLRAGSGVSNAIFKAAGYKRLQEACDKIGHCDVGSAVITRGFDLKAKYIIHAVGPKWVDGQHEETEQLTEAYMSALELAVKNNCASIAFPLISAGRLGCPAEMAWRNAICACRQFLHSNPESDLNVIFATRRDDLLQLGRKLLKEEVPEYTTLPAEKGDWKTVDMPEQNDRFILNRYFNEDQMKVLRRGNVPQKMEDKWFWYMEGNQLYAHRSWTGFCIFIIEFSEDDCHRVIVNRDPEQHQSNDIADNIDTLNRLLNWWTVTPYDYYGEWLEEVSVAFSKQELAGKKLNIAGREAGAVYFHKPSELDSYLSNWYPSPMLIEGLQFSSVEQYIMYKKCKIFGDEKAAQMVLATDNTRRQQSIGRKVNGYISNVWAGMRQVVAIRGLFAKFSQNEGLKKNLLLTGDKYIVECSRTDKIWACGIPLDDDRRFDAANWDGQNILGFALMEVREMLK